MKSFWIGTKEIITNKKLMTSIFITLCLLILFRIGSIITIPLVDPSNINSTGSNNSFTDLLNLIGGGGLSRFSIFALGIGPYITAQIIVQLLSTDLVPPLQRLAKSGEKGRKQLDMISRLITLPFAILQVFAVVQLLDNTNLVKFGELDATKWAYLMAILVAGTYFAIFLGDLITKKGVGNGLSLIIAAGVISHLRFDFATVFRSIGQNYGTNINLIFNFSLYIVFSFLMIIFVAIINGSVRKIPIQKTGQGVIGSDQLPYLPIKVNSAGILPVIFASSFLSIPITIAQILPPSAIEHKWNIEDYVSFNSWVGISIYFSLVVLFTFFYSYIQTNPEELSKNLRNSGSFIVGIRPGEDTERHITKVLNRINWLGGPFIAIIACLPYVVQKLFSIPSNTALGGTGIIILVSVCIETFKAIQSSKTSSNYSKKTNFLITSNENITNNNNSSGSTIW